MMTAASQIKSALSGHAQPPSASIGVGIMNKFAALLIYGGIGVLSLAGGILLALYSSTLQRAFNSAHWVAVTAYRGGNLLSIVGLCLIVVGYLEFRRR